VGGYRHILEKMIAGKNNEVAEQLRELCCDRGARDLYLTCYREWLEKIGERLPEYPSASSSTNRTATESAWTSDDGRKTFTGQIEEVDGGETKMSFTITSIAGSTVEHAAFLRQLADELERMSSKP
jgi:hypothetical protein